MTQVRRNSRFKASFGQRLTELVDEHLQISWESLSDRLAYANSTTVRQAGRGKALLSAEKLSLLARLTDNHGRRVSVDWLLTGLGEPFCMSARIAKDTQALSQRVARAPKSAQAKIASFLEVLSSNDPPSRKDKILPG